MVRPFNLQNVSGSISVKTVLLVLVVFIAGLGYGMFLIPQMYRNGGSSNQNEAIELTDQHFWGANINSAGEAQDWTEAAIALVNIGHGQVVLKRISVLGVPCEWSKVYYWKTNYGPPTDLKQTSANLSGTSGQLTIDGIERSFLQVGNEIDISPQ